MTDENEKTHTLVASSTSGRYALDDAIYGHALTSGERIAIYLNGCWITGRVEHGSLLYAINDYVAPMGVKSGYYFLSDKGGELRVICGHESQALW